MKRFDYGARLGRLRSLMDERGVATTLLSVGADLPYFTGYEATPLERLTMAVIPTHGRPTLVVPRLEAPRVVPEPDVFDIRPWDETEDPVAIVAEFAAGICAIGDQTWARFLLELKSAMADSEFRSATPLTAELRMRKDDAEVELLRQAGAATDRVVARLAGVTFSGRTERDVAAEVAAMTLEEGHDSAEFGIIASGPNGASPHHEPGERVIVPGDAVVVDFGGRLGGYCSDTTRNFVVGEPSAEYREAFDVLVVAQTAAVDAVAPGVTAETIDATARQVIDDAGWGEYFVHRTGHGIGLEVHEEPYIVAGSSRPLEPGMAFSVEPGIYVPGEFGMRIEDIVIVTDDGVERLNQSPREYTVVA